MYRHTLLAILIAIALAPSVALAQTTEPVGTVSPSDTEVARAYDNPNVYFDETVGVMALGSTHESEEDAARAASTYPTLFASSLTSELEGDVPGEGDFVFEEVEEVPIAPLGDDSTASRAPFTMFGSFEGEYVFLMVRQGTWVQMLVGFGVGDVDVVADLEAIATTIQPRWPTTDPIVVREDGLRTGGIWNMTPMPEDLPAGFVLDEEFEEGPAATAESVVPVGTPASNATPVEPSRDLPLIPTPTPEVSDPLPTAVPETPATVPTPAAINPRLALPFDVTIEIILPLDLATVAEDGSCSGDGLFAGLTAGGSLTLRNVSDGSAAVSAPITAPGMVTYDTLDQEDVCYFAATITQVPARAEYTLLAGESVLGQYTYEDLTTGEPVLIDLGGE